MKDIMQAMKERHSVRRYLNKPLAADAVEALQKLTDECNRESGLHLQLITNEPESFAKNFPDCSAYIALVGKNDKNLDELCGYYGEKLVLLAQQYDINSCWAALTFRNIKNAYKLEAGEKLTAEIALGYGENQGREHRSKSFAEVTRISGEAPQWFRDGVEAALLAPTAINQQKFTFAYKDGEVTAAAGLGPYAKMDLGIVKYHFEIGSGGAVRFF